MNDNKKTSSILTKLYGGLNMSWITVLLLALGSAVVTAIFLVAPVFKDTSFEQMGVTMEAWIFLAVLIMVNCKSPLEAACKVFVFFLVSQPLIYLFQVPFSWQGWGLFSYYPRWFVLTLATFPASWVGWFIRKRDWRSALILFPVMLLLGVHGASFFQTAAQRFPQFLLAGLFCLGQMVLYAVLFLPKPALWLTGAVLPAVIVLVYTLAQPPLSLNVTYDLDEAFSEEAVLTVSDGDMARIQLIDPAEGTLYLYVHKYGTTTLTVTDGETVNTYTLHVYYDKGVARVEIT